MRRLVNALLVVLIAGVLAIVVSVVLALKSHVRRDPPAQAPSAEIGLRPSERLVGAQATETRVSLIIEAADGERRVILLDAATLAPVGAASVNPR